jgi:hypothetical protein
MTILTGLAHPSSKGSPGPQIGYTTAYIRAVKSRQEALIFNKRDLVDPSY